ncbi:DUF4345 domain-containing protein [Actinokineospora diospyrosa]|uniref:DUF4345 domain-containing protein n=1 Tax=Actinokineospora diospyrosa TaxID=103728 RepID=A0ABT1ILX6_9PSEU|nr:DUF4345 domain-containing protein [Actinokineospora diospyrosa]MCP2273516.1 protein of unknown function (DUF4345) [Actinokineospora diospyrosa]
MANRIILGLAGLVAVAIGAAQLLAPAAFHEASGLPAVHDPGALGEIRAVGAAILGIGGVITAGVFRPGLSRLSALLGTGFYLAFGAGRALGVAVDGVPPGSLLGAMAAEIVLGLACAYVLARTRVPVAA